MNNVLVIFQLFVIINGVAALFVIADPFQTQSMAYDSTYFTVGNNTKLTNSSFYPSQETEQSVQTWGVFELIYNSMTMNWILTYIPSPYKEALVITTMIGIGNIVILLVGIATFWQLARRIPFFT
jgi:hypothetical protein